MSRSTSTTARWAPYGYVGIDRVDISGPRPPRSPTTASLGFDYVCIDLQHGLNDYDGMANALAAMAGSGATPLVRVPWNEPGIIGRALDAGAAGVIIPMVNSVDEAQRAASACHYWPTGTRSFGPIALGARGGFAGIEAANEQVLCIPMIETREAVEQIDDILGVPGISAVYVGPADLSITYGLPSSRSTTRGSRSTAPWRRWSRRATGMASCRGSMATPRWRRSAAPRASAWSPSAAN